jgi:hypothetical protein
MQGGGACAALVIPDAGTDIRVARRRHHNTMIQSFRAQVLIRKKHHEHKQAGGGKKLDCRMQQICNKFFL